MRIALLSDIHGNLVALNSVLDNIAGGRIDKLVCLGDVALFGPQPQATLRRIRDLGCPVVMGYSCLLLSLPGKMEQFTRD